MGFHATGVKYNCFLQFHHRDSLQSSISIDTNIAALTQIKLKYISTEPIFLAYKLS